MKLQTAPAPAPVVQETIVVSPLVEKLEHFVHARTNGMVRNLRVTVIGNEVTLSGLAPTYYTKQLATHAVFNAADGVTLINSIDVVR